MSGSAPPTSTSAIARRVSFAAEADAAAASSAAAAVLAAKKGESAAKKADADEEDEVLDVTSVASTFADDDPDDGNPAEACDRFSPLKEDGSFASGGRRGSTLRSATTTTASSSSAASTKSWDEAAAAVDASELSWEFAIDASSTLRQSKTMSKPGQRRESSFSRQSKRTSDMTIDKLQFHKLDTLYGRNQERQVLLDAWEGLKAQAGESSAVESNRRAVFVEEDAAASPMAANEPPRARAPTAAGAKAAIRRVVTVSGSSGTGKTRLVEVLRWPVTRGGGFFLSGKFPQKVRLSNRNGAVEPYAAFVAACNALLDVALSLDGSDDQGGTSRSSFRSASSFRRRDSQSTSFSVSAFRGRLIQDLDPLSIKVLIRVVPSLAHVLATDEAGSGSANHHSEEMLDFRQVQQQLRFAFRKFFRAVGAFGPVVLAMDDLQWADAASMELLESLASDRENASLMIVASFRDDDAYSQCPHITSLENLRAASEHDPSLQLVSVRVGDLRVEQVNELLVDLLSCPSPTVTEGLAEIVHKKTNGNVFFVIQFLTVLQESQLLAFNFGAMKWVWDVEEVRLSTAATENVVSLLKKKMRRLPASVGFVLPIMACLGSTFHEPLLAVVVDRVGPPQEEGCASVSEEPERPRNASELLAACIEEGLIEPGTLDRGVETYQWVHDKIQETAVTLLSDDEIQALKFRMGTVLLEGLGDHDLDRYIFTVVDLLNTESTNQESFRDPVEIAKLYLRAGVKTVENSAFDQAGGYLARGISLLPSGHWNTNYDISLELFSVAAQADFCSGNVDRMRTYCDEVIRQDSIPLLDKRRVYNAIVDAKCGECTALALDICREILAKLGVQFPRFGVTFHVICGMINVKAKLRKATDLPSLLSDVPDMEDEMKQWTMVLLDKFATYAYLSKSPLLPLAIFKGFRMTLSDGVSFVSPVMFSLVGLSLAAFVQDYKGGADFADEAVAMLKRVKGARQIEARVLMVIHCFVLHWQRPIQMSTKPLLTAYEGGMAIGDTESASWSAITYIEFTLRSGGVLDDMLADCAFYGEQMRGVKQLNTLDTLCQMWQALLHLTGANPFNGKLSGDVANPDIAQRHEQFFATHYRWQMYVAFVLEEYELVYDTIIRTRQHKHFYEDILPGTLGICHLYAYNGLAMISLYRATKRQKFLRLGKKFFSKIHGFAQAGNPNVTHFDHLLEAEMLSLRGKTDESSKQYEAAILYCGRRGMLQDRALAHERYGEHFARLGVDYDQDTEFHINEAIKLYSDWGAHPKVQLMRQKYSKYASQ